MKLKYSWLPLKWSDASLVLFQLLKDIWISIIAQLKVCINFREKETLLSGYMQKCLLKLYLNQRTFPRRHRLADFKHKEGLPLNAAAKVTDIVCDFFRVFLCHKFVLPFNIITFNLYTASCRSSFKKSGFFGATALLRLSYVPFTSKLSNEFVNH